MTDSTSGEHDAHSDSDVIEVGSGWDALWPEDLIEPFGSFVAAFQHALDRIYEMEDSSLEESKIEDALLEACPELSLNADVKLYQLGVDGGCARLLTTLGACVDESDFDTGGCGTSGVTYEVTATHAELADWTATLERGTKLLTTLPDGSVLAASGDTGDSIGYLSWHHCSVIGDVLTLLAQTEELIPEDQDWAKIFGDLLPSWGSYLSADSEFPPWDYGSLLSELESFPGIMVTIGEEPKVDLPGQAFLDIEVHIDIRSIDEIEKTFTAFHKALKSYRPLMT